MANKPTKPKFPLGLESQDQSVFQEGILNNGVIEHGPDAVMTVPETPDASGVPSAVRYNEDEDQFEGYYNEGGWLPLGGGNGGRWELLPHASSSLLQIGRAYLVDNTDGASTVVFPSPKRVGDSITVCDLFGKFSTYPLTVDGNGKSIYGSADSMTISTDNVSATFTWTGEARGWVITSGVGLGQGRVYSREIYSQILSATTPSITLSTQPSIVDVYVDGKRLKESLYTLDGYEVKFDPALASGSDVQIIQYIPIQLGAGGGGSGGTVITWEYNGGSAIGGETQIVLDVVVDSVSEIYIRGTRQQIGRGFTFDPSTSTITLADELEAGDDVVVVINGDPTVYNQIDRTPWEVARANNVSNAEVILSTDKTSVLDGKTVLYDVLTQKYWGVPAGLPAGVKIISVTGEGVLVFTSNVSVQMEELGPSVLKKELGLDSGTSLVAKLGNKPMVAVSYYKNKGMSDQDAVQAAFDESSNVLIDTDVTLTDYVTLDRSTECYVYRKPGVTITGHGYLPKLRTNPAHVAETTIRHSKTSDPNAASYDRVYSHQTLATEMVVHDVASAASSSENFVALYSGIETFNCGKQRIWAFNSVTNAHNLLTGDEVYGYELDMNVDGTLDGGGQYVGLYIAGIGDLSTCANADGIRVQRLRNGVDKWQYGLRIFDSMTGISITDASTYSIFAGGSAPIVRRKTTQDGGWSYIHSLSASLIKWGVDDYGDTYSRRLYLGTGDGKSKNRVNLDGGVKYYTTNNAVAWGAIAANAYVDKDITSLVGVSIADWTNYTIDVTPIGYAGAMPVVAVQAYINSAKTQAYVRVINISGAALSSCNVGLNIKVSGHSATN